MCSCIKPTKPENLSVRFHIIALTMRLVGAVVEVAKAVVEALRREGGIGSSASAADGVSSSELQFPFGFPIRATMILHIIKVPLRVPRRVGINGHSQASAVVLCSFHSCFRVDQGGLYQYGSSSAPGLLL